MCSISQVSGLPRAHHYAGRMRTYLDDILSAHRRQASLDHREIEELSRQASSAPAPRDFVGVLRSPGLSVIAEIKRRSPSKGLLADGLDPTSVARSYESGGAAALSVLTDGAHFGGSPEDLAVAKAAVPLPILRKDFTVDVRDVLDARIMGADAVLLIVAALDDRELKTFAHTAASVGLTALFEVHDEEELERALELDAIVIGVNQRDLKTFNVDTERAERMGALIPSDCVAIAESGVRDGHDAQRLASAGYDAVLVGESLVTSGDPAAAVSAMAGHEVTPRGGHDE